MRPGRLVRAGRVARPALRDRRESSPFALSALSCTLTEQNVSGILPRGRSARQKRERAPTEHKDAAPQDWKARGSRTAGAVGTQLGLFIVTHLCLVGKFPR